MRSVLIAASVVLALYQIFSMIPARSDVEAQAVQAAVVPKAAKPAATSGYSDLLAPIRSAYEESAPRSDIVDCGDHFRRAAAACGRDDACRIAAQDRRDLCEATGFWRTA